MKTTLEEKNAIRTIIGELINENADWFKQYNIGVRSKDDFWVLNYGPGPRNNFNRLVRGMVVQKPVVGFQGDVLSLIRSFPFIRFYNQGEAEAAAVDFSNAEMLEKMDGTMVGVFFPNGSPEFHTRKMLSTFKDDMNLGITTFAGSFAKFMPEIKKYVIKLNFGLEDQDFTYIFEFVHEISYVLTKYLPSQYGLYLLGARNVKTHEEFSEDQLDLVAKKIGAFRPRRFEVISDFEQIQQMFKTCCENNADFEGFVFRDKITGHRLKVKDPDYVAKHHLLDNSSFRRLIPIILKEEEEEVMAVLPHTIPRVAEFKKIFNDYVETVIQITKEWQAKGLSGRELTVAIFGEEMLPKWKRRLLELQGTQLTKPQKAIKDGFVCDIILRYNDVLDENILKQNIIQELHVIALGQGTNEGNPKTLMEILKITDMEVDQSDIGEL